MKPEVILYNAYKPFANFIKKFDIYESLYVVWAYAQNLQYDMPIPNDISFPRFMNGKHVVWKRAYNASEWELEYLTKEIILNCEEKRRCNDSLKVLKNFRKCIGFIRNINEVSGNFLTQENTLKELYRMTHRQFIWQHGVNGMSFIRYYKIYSNEQLNEIIKSVFNMDVKTLMKIGMLLYLHYIKSYFIQFPIKNDKLKSISERDLNYIAATYTSSILELKTFYKANQRIDMDIFYYENLLKIKPLIKVDNTLISPLPTLMYWQITQGLFYFMIDKKNLNFDNAYGQSFQNYVGELIEEINVNKKFKVYCEMEYEIKKGNQNRTSDWIIESIDSIILVECKTKRIKLKSKIGLYDEESLKSDIEAISDSIVQIYKQVLNYKNNLYPEIPYRDSKKIYPIIVSLENWYLFNFELFERITKEAKKKLINVNLDSKVIDEYPFTVFSIDEFEVEFQKMEYFGIEKYMRNRFLIEKDERIQSFEPLKLFDKSLQEIIKN